MAEQIKLDDKRALNYYKEDANLKKKIISFYLYSLLCMIPFLNIIFVPFFAIKISGYFLNNTRTRVFKPENILPEWGDKKHLGIGFKALIANLAIGIPVNIIYYVLVAPMSASKDTSMMLFAFLIGVVLFLIPPLYYSIAVLAFVTDFKIKSFFNIKAIKYIIKNELFGNYLSKIVVYSLVYIVSLILAAVTIIGALAIPAIIFIYLAIISDIQAQFIRYVFKIGQKK